MSAKSVATKSPRQQKNDRSAQAEKAAGGPARRGAAGASGIEHYGLDMGTSRLVRGHMRGDDPAFATQLNAFVSLPNTRMNRNMLEREHIQFTTENTDILAFGNRVEEFANLLGGDTRRPMKDGLLNPGEPRNLDMIARAVKRLLGPANKGQRVCFSVPSAPEGEDASVIFHERSISRILEDLGYEVRSINEGQAVVLAELVSSDFTGIGISFGGGMCNVCLSYLGLPALTFSTTRAGDFIDYSAAAVVGETPVTARQRKESDEFDLDASGGTSLDQALSIYYREVIQTVALTCERVVAASRRLPSFRQPVPVVFSGGSALARGFGEELERALGRIDLPFEIADVKMAESGMNATAKGCLVAALLDN